MNEVQCLDGNIMKPPCPVKRFFTADPHFGHTHILRYEAQNRRDAYGSSFASIDHMDTYLVDQWNATVAAGDLVYCLGDFSYKLHTMHAILPYLNGAKVLIVGNHDPFFKGTSINHVKPQAVPSYFSRQ